MLNEENKTYLEKDCPDHETLPNCSTCVDTYIRYMRNGGYEDVS